MLYDSQIIRWISYISGNTPGGVPVWAVATNPNFFKEARPILKRHMWQERRDSGGYGSGRSQDYTLDLEDLSLAMWGHVLMHHVQVWYDPPRKFYGRHTHLHMPVVEINYNATAVKKTDGYWMQIKSSNATPRFDYSLCIEPNYD